MQFLLWFHAIAMRTVHPWHLAILLVKMTRVHIFLHTEESQLYLLIAIYEGFVVECTTWMMVR